MNRAQEAADDLGELQIPRLVSQQALADRKASERLRLPAPRNGRARWPH